MTVPALGHPGAGVGRKEEGEEEKTRKERRKQGRRREKRRGRGIGKGGRGGRREEGGGAPQGSACPAAPSAGGCGESTHGSLPVRLCQSLKEVVILGSGVIGSLENRKLSSD